MQSGEGHNRPQTVVGRSLGKWLDVLRCRATRDQGVPRSISRPEAEETGDPK